MFTTAYVLSSLLCLIAACALLHRIRPVQPTTQPTPAAAPTYTLTPAEETAVLKLRKNDLCNRQYYLQLTEEACFVDTKRALRDWSSACQQYVSNNYADRAEYHISNVDLTRANYLARVEQQKGVCRRIAGMEPVLEALQAKLRMVGGCGDEEDGLEEYDGSEEEEN